jgi:Family of unknown function (DUF6452)
MLARRFTTIVGAFLLLQSLCSCEQNDICTEGKTPKLNIQFLNSEGKLSRRDSIYVDVDFGQAAPKTVLQVSNVESILVPLRVDDAPETKLWIYTRKKGTKDQITLQYKPVNEYVSPACGVRKIYQNVGVSLPNAPQNIKSYKLSTNEITNETASHLLLTF